MAGRWLEISRMLAVVRSKLRTRGSVAADERGVASFYDRTWREAAAEIGADVVELGAGFLEIRLGGRRTRVWGQHVEVDHPLTLQLAGDKAVVHGLLRAESIAVPDFASFHLGTLADAEAFLAAQDGPCVVKPGRGTGGGRGVFTNVRTKRQLRRAAVQASVWNRKLIIESQLAGDGYRLLYLDGELLDAVCRRPPRVVGDGKSSVRRLIERENARRAERGGAAATGRILVDADCEATLERDGRSLATIPEEGESVPVKSISNAGSELDSESVLAEIGDELRAQGARAAEIVGVRLAGVDVITTDPSVSPAACGGAFNEINTTPGLHWHYRVRDPERRVPVCTILLRRLLAAPEGA